MVRALPSEAEHWDWKDKAEEYDADAAAAGKGGGKDKAELRRKAQLYENKPLFKQKRCFHYFNGRHGCHKEECCGFAHFKEELGQELSSNNNN